MKTGILLFEQMHGKKEVGSSRIRGHWVLKHWDAAPDSIGPAELYRFGGRYEAVIYQKAYFVDHARQFPGVKVFDLCDPDWLDWGCRLVEMLQHCDAVTASSEALAESIRGFTKLPVYFVPDGVELDQLPPPVEHVGPTQTVVWFGYQQNFPILDAAVPALIRRGLELVVVSDGVYVPKANMAALKLRNLPFSQANYLRDVQQGQVCLNPRWGNGKWKYKSDNKTSIARALGLPVAHDEDELAKLMTEEERKAASAEGLAWVREHRDVRQSAAAYQRIIREAADKKQKWARRSGCC